MVFFNRKEDPRLPLPPANSIVRLGHCDLGLPKIDHGPALVQLHHNLRPFRNRLGFHLTSDRPPVLTRDHPHKREACSWVHLATGVSALTGVSTLITPFKIFLLPASAVSMRTT